jgi:hypothetical protein
MAAAFQPTAPSGAVQAEQVRLAGQQRREQELAARQAQLEAARLEAERDRQLLAQRMQQHGEHQNYQQPYQQYPQQHQSHQQHQQADLDVSAMSVEEDQRMFEVEPLSLNGQYHDGMSQQQQVLASKAQRQEQAEQQYLRQLEAARVQNLQDQRALAERMGMV